MKRQRYTEGHRNRQKDKDRHIEREVPDWQSKKCVISEMKTFSSEGLP